MAAYGVGTAQIGGLTVNNPLRLENTKAAPTKAAPASAPAAKAPVKAAVAPPTPTGGGAVYDPAAAAAAAAQAQAAADYGNTKAATYGSIGQSEDEQGAHYNSDILDYIGELQKGQKAIDSQTVQNELSKRQGTAGVLDMIGHGVKNIGTILADRGAGSSSATDAFARGYSDLGRKELSGVGNQYEQGKSGIADAQDQFGIDNATNLRHLSDNKNDIVNGIVSSAQDALSVLNAKAASASLPDRIDIEAEKQRIKNEALTKLQSFDAQLTAAQAANGPISTNDARTKAAALATAGTAATNPFTFTANTPAQLANTGPFASELPLFTAPKKQTV